MPVWIVLLIVNLAIAAIVAGIAEKRGESAVGWFFFSLLLWPAALIALFVKSPSAEQVEAKQLASGDRRPCPHCAELIKAAANVCRFCGRDVEPVALATAPAGPPLLVDPDAKHYL